MNWHFNGNWKRPSLGMERVCDAVRVSVSFQKVSVKLDAGSVKKIPTGGYLRSGMAVLCPNQESPAQNRRRLVRTLMSR